MRNVSIAVLVLCFAACNSVLAQLPPGCREESLTAVKDSHMIAGLGGGTNKGNGGMYYWEGEGLVPAVMDTTLYQWDVSGVALGVNEVIRGVEMELFSCDVGPYRAEYQLTAYPMREPWQEGVGVPTDGYGGKGFPWGPTSLGDATFNWSSVTATGPGAPPFDTQIVGTDGVPWEVAGGLGTTSDCYPREMMDYHILLPQGPYPEGVSYGRWSLKNEGLKVVADWMSGALTNNGLVLAHEEVDPTVYNNLRPAARERSAVSPGTLGPQLHIVIGPALLPGDVHDPGEAGYGCVDGADYTIWADNYNTSGHPYWGLGGYRVGNFTDDDTVDGADYTIWADHYLQGCPHGPVPEPATLVLALGGLLAVVRKRR